MAKLESAGKTPTAAQQIEASKALAQAKRRIDAAELKLRGAKNAAERIDAQRMLREASAEQQFADKKYGWIVEWQKAQTALKEAGTKAKGVADAAARDAGAVLKTAETKLAGKPAAVKKHVVKKNESLSLIAKQYYGDVKKWKKIYEANKQVVGANPDLIQPGMELVIPD
jgi:nucleoid-associated protein YgaU